MGEVIQYPYQRRVAQEMGSEVISERHETIIVNFFTRKIEAIVQSDERPTDQVLALASLKETSAHESQPQPKTQRTSHSLPDIMSPLKKLWAGVAIAGINRAKSIVEGTTGAPAVAARSQAKLRIIKGGVA